MIGGMSEHLVRGSAARDVWRLQYDCGHRLDFRRPTSMAELAQRADWLAQRWQACDRCTERVAG
jgi:hypothetical protein